MMTSLTIRSEETETVMDITERVQDLIEKNRFTEAVCILFVTHTTCALSTADLDPGTDKDMLEAFRGMIPKLDYRHRHDPSHVGDHISATLMGPSTIVPVQEGKLTLDTWQHVVLVEFNGPKEREIVVTCIASSS